MKKCHLHAESDGNGWEDNTLVAQGQAKDDVGGPSSAAGISHILQQW